MWGSGTVCRFLHANVRLRSTLHSATHILCIYNTWFMVQLRTVARGRRARHDLRHRQRSEERKELHREHAQHHALFRSFPRTVSEWNLFHSFPLTVSEWNLLPTPISTTLTLGPEEHKDCATEEEAQHHVIFHSFPRTVSECNLFHSFPPYSLWMEPPPYGYLLSPFSWVLPESARPQSSQPPASPHLSLNIKIMYIVLTFSSAVLLNVLGCRLTLGTSWDQCRSMVQHSFTSTETRKLVRTDSSGRPSRLSHSSWIIIVLTLD